MTVIDFATKNAMKISAGEDMSNKTIEELEEDLSFALAQPAMDHVCRLIKKGKNKEAIKQLISEEGHWLSAGDSVRIVDYWTEKFGPKPIDKLIEKAKKMDHEKILSSFSVDEIVDMLIRVLPQIRRDEY